MLAVGNVGSTAGGILEIPIRFIFDNENVVLLAELIDLLATRHAKNTTGGVLAQAACCVSDTPLVRLDEKTYVTVYIR